MKLQKLLSSALFLGLASSLSAQSQLVVVNGGLYGSTNYANVTVNGNMIDEIGTTSAQDAYIEDNQYLYVAAQDSIVKYDLTTNTRLAAVAFGGLSTIKLTVSGNYLFVGNWYGQTSDNLTVLDKSDLSDVTTIPEIVHGAKDFVAVDDMLYVSQNLNGPTTGYQDSLGYIAVVDINTLTWVRNDTISTNGDDVGRMIQIDDSTIVTLNSISNTLLHYNTNTGMGTSLAANVDLQLKGYGTGAIYGDTGNTWWLPFDGGIGQYDVVTATSVATNVVPFDGSGGWTFDAINNEFYVSSIDFGNQGNNTGVKYDVNGDSLSTFAVGFSPEVLTMWYDFSINTTAINAPSINTNIYPTPSINNAFIDTNRDIENVAYQIFSLDGQLVQQANVGHIFNQTPIEINTTNLSSGMYIIQLVGDDYQYTSQLIKQ